MKKIARRAAACLLLVLFMAGGMAFYLARYLKDGGEWVSFPVNRHVFSDARLAVGTVSDRDGYTLASVSGRERLYSQSEIIRRATLHAVGDLEGNIGTGALSYYATDLMGYNPVTGVFSTGGEGNDLRLTIDASLSAVAYEAMAGRKGAVSLYNYKTGEILCMVSTPGYDPYDPPGEEEIASDAYEGAYINRCLSSSFTPGSVFKVVTLAAAVERLPDLYDMVFHCPGYAEVDGERVNCFGVHGDIGIEDALANSCNAAFAELAVRLGGETLRRYASDYGLLDSFSVSGIPAAAGGFTAAPDGSSDLAWSGIGQHEDLVNPLAMARLMGAIANGGTAVDPRIVSGLSTPLGLPGGFRYHLRSVNRIMKRDTAEALGGMLRYNVEAVYGEYYRFSEYEGFSAKSGSAELTDGQPPHAWMAGYLDSEKYPVAFSVIVENGGMGLTQAGAVIDRVLAALTD